MPKRMLVNFSDPDECRVAVMQDRELEELFIERTSTEHYVGNIYKGRVENVEPSIQAAFVELGLERNGFLHVSDVNTDYVKQAKVKKAPHQFPRLQQVLRRGQEVVVQVTKSGIGTKGPALTTYLSLPGRFLVLMPNIKRHGVSRKIEDDEQRQELKDILHALNAPEDMGVIVRTAGRGRGKRELQRDLAYLQRLYQAIQKRVKSVKAPALLYQETDLVTRVIRDFFTPDTDEIVIDNEAMLAKAVEFMQGVMPRYANRVRLYSGDVPIFHAYGVEKHIENIYARRVDLPGGGYIVIDQTEALVAIDVNSGSYRERRDPEESAFQLNMLAAKEIARQLRLRDLGGVVIIDFVDLLDQKHISALEKALHDALKVDKARYKTLKMSEFGIVQMTRQRMRPSVRRSMFQECPHCHGSGQMRTAESMAVAVLRVLPMALAGDDIYRVEVTVAGDVAEHLNNAKRLDLASIEKRYGKGVVVREDGGGVVDTVRFVRYDRSGSAREWTPSHELPADVLAKLQKPVDLAAIKRGELPFGEEEEEPAEKEAVLDRRGKPVQEPVAIPYESPEPVEVMEGNAVAAERPAGSEEPPGEPGREAAAGQDKQDRRRRRPRGRRRGGRGRRRHKTAEQAAQGNAAAVAHEQAAHGEPDSALSAGARAPVADAARERLADAGAADEPGEPQPARERREHTRAGGAEPPEALAQSRRQAEGATVPDLEPPAASVSDGEAPTGQPAVEETAAADGGEKPKRATRRRPRGGRGGASRRRRKVSAEKAGEGGSPEGGGSSEAAPDARKPDASSEPTEPPASDEGGQ